MNFFETVDISGDKIFNIGAAILIALLINYALQYTLKIIFRNLSQGDRLTSHTQRLNTLRILVNNVLTVVIYSLVTAMILKELGFDIIPLLTGAGLLGLAISFGAQTLVKDLISGFFIIIENQYNVGDEVEIGDFKGRISRINLRTIVLKDKDDNKIYIPNSEIKNVLVFKKKVK